MKVALYRRFNEKIQSPFKVLDLTWDEFVDYLGARGWMRDDDVAVEPAYAEKSALPLWSGAELKPGTTRKNENVVAVHAIALDFDEYTLTEDVQWAFGDYYHLVHTTWSSVPWNPRCRLILPLRRPVNAEEFRSVIDWALKHAEENGLKPDRACKDPARFFFMPAMPFETESTYRYTFTDASDNCSMLDPDEILGGRAEPGDLRAGVERMTNSVTVRVEGLGEVDVLEWARRTPYVVEDQKGVKLKCACPYVEDASPGSAFLRRVRSGVVLVCMSERHGHPYRPMKWFFRLGMPDAEDADDPILNAKPDNAVLPYLKKTIDKKGRETNQPVKSLANMVRILELDRRFKGRLWRNDFRGIECLDDGPILKKHVTEARIVLEEAYDMPAADENVYAAMVYTAGRHARNPLVDWLKGLPKWDGTPRIDTWLVSAFGSEDTPLTRAMGAKWLLSAIGRAFQPGCKVDTMLVTYGPQGIGKSTVFRALAPTVEEIGTKVFTDAQLDLDDKDSSMIISGAWIVEFAEFKDITRKDVERVKQVLTAQEDEFRPPYERAVVTIPRHCVMCGTVNRPDILVDETGNRRFWVVHAPTADPRWVRENRDQLWAEAIHRYDTNKSGLDPWVLTREEELALIQSNARYEQQDPWVEPIAQWVASWGPGKFFSISDVLSLALGKQKANHTWHDQRRVSNIVRKHLGLGEPIVRTVEGVSRKVWVWSPKDGEDNVIRLVVQR